VKPRTRIAAMFRSSGNGQSESVRGAVAPASSGDVKGSGAPASRRARTTLAVLALAIAAFAATAASASADDLAAEMGTITDPSYVSAHVTGKVTTPGALLGRTAYSFEYCADGLDCADDANWHVGLSGSLGEAPAVDKEVPEVPGRLTVPKAGKYFVRLSADTLSFISSPAKATSPEPYPSFTTLPVDPPTILAADDASEVFSISAKATGKVKHPANNNPAFDVTKCRFEYITDAQFLANEGAGDPAFKGALGAECAEISPENPLIGENAEKVVSAQLSDLSPGTTYHLRLAAENASPTAAVLEANTFITPTVAKPTVTATDDASEVVYNGANFTGKVLRPAGDDPGLDVNCRFEYVTQAQFEAEEFAAAAPNGQVAGCTQNPITADKVDGGGEIAVSAGAGLSPTTTYHLRLIAENAGGSDTMVAADTFTTPEADKPIITIDLVEGGTFTTAHITGTVTLTDGHTGGGQVYVQMSTDGGATWDVSPPMLWTSPSGKCSSTGQIGNCTPAEEGVYPVEVDLTGLQPSTTYLFRIAASYHPLFTTNGGPGIPVIEARGEVAHSPEPNPSITTEPPQTLPTADNLAVTDVTATSAHFSGTVNPNAPAGPLSPAAKKAFATHWEFVCVPECKDKNENPIEGTVQGEEGAQTVTGDVKRLEPGTEYTVSLIVSNEGGSDSEEETFPTDKIPPSVKQTPGASDGTGGYTLQGVVNPNKETIIDCKFRWGPSSNKLVFSADCSPMPDPGVKPTTVEAHLTGLTPDVDYYSQLVVTYDADPVDLEADSGDPQQFKAELAAKEPCPANEQQRIESNSLALPECRAYEMVSPPGKEGWGASLVTFDGGVRVRFNSGAANIAKSGQNNGANEYVAARSATGWETIPNLNGSGGGTIADAPSSFAAVGAGTFPQPSAYSDDLLSSVWFGHRQDGSAGTNTYLRKPDGLFTLVGVLPPDATEEQQNLELYSAGASDDLSHVFYGPHPFWGYAAWGPGVYEFVGTGNEQPPRRADVDNLGSPISTCSYGALAKFHSKDGRVFAFLVTPCGGGSSPITEIWARVNGTTSFDVSASRCDRTAADPGGVCNGPVGNGSCVYSDNQETGSGCRGAIFQGAAGDGSRVFFTTKQQLLDADIDETNDLYACDIPAGTPAPTAEKANHCSALRQVSVGDPTGAAVESVSTVSDDGSTVLFIAKGVLADNEDALKEKAVAGDHNLYVWRTDAAHPDGQTTFVGGLDSNDLVNANAGIKPQITSDGRYLAFTTASRLVDTDTDSARDVYRYDADTDEPTRVSTNVFGVAGNGDFGARISIPAEHNPTTTISEDGQKIVFTTDEALNAAADGNEDSDVYLWTPTRVSLISAGSVGSGGDNPAITASGDDIYFNTPGALTPADGDDQADVYDARIGGGFSFSPTPICTGEACQPPAIPAPPTKAPLSAIPGPGNPKQKPPCPKGKVRNKKGKCVKKPSKKHHHKKGHKRHAKSDRGASK